MKPRRSTKSDVEKILKTYLASTELMLNQGIDQWHYNYPNIHNIEKDIRLGISYIIEVEGNVGVIAIDKNQDEQYTRLKWPYKSESPLVIHRLAVHPILQGKGIGKRLCLFAEEIALKKSCDSIRLDAYSTYQASNQLYLSLGYEKAEGFCYFHDNKNPFYCFEKRINNV